VRIVFLFGSLVARLSVVVSGQIDRGPMIFNL